MSTVNARTTALVGLALRAGCGGRVEPGAEPGSGSEFDAASGTQDGSRVARDGGPDATRGSTPASRDAGEVDAVAMMLGLDDTSIYWTINIFSGPRALGLPILKAPLLGGQLATLARGQDTFGIALDSTGAYWSDSVFTDAGNDGFRMMATPLAGGATVTLPRGGSAMTLASNQGTVWGDSMAADAVTLYWVGHGTSGQHSVVSASVAGGLVTTLVTMAPSSQSHSSRVALDANRVYWTTTWSGGDVMAVPRAGGAASTLASGQYYPSAIATDGVNVYWTTGLDGRGAGNGDVIRMPAAGGTPTTLASEPGQLFDIAVDATSVYWSQVRKLTPK